MKRGVTVPNARYGAALGRPPSSWSVARSVLTQRAIAGPRVTLGLQKICRLRGPLRRRVIPLPRRRVALPGEASVHDRQVATHSCDATRRDLEMRSDPSYAQLFDI